jgi:CRISPR/Cas system endoribonuclease Cas6 (RAMP superfamily)
MSLVVATLQVDEEIVLIDRHMPEKITKDPTQEVYLDVRGVKNPGSRGRNVRYRVAASAGWRATFHITWDVTVISRGEMEAVLIDAGKLCGLGNGRTIGFGRFEVEEFEVIEDAQETAAA